MLSGLQWKNYLGYRYYNEAVCEELADVITFEEAIALLGGKE